jgi:hypothetical protein
MNTVQRDSRYDVYSGNASPALGNLSIRLWLLHASVIVVPTLLFAAGTPAWSTLAVGGCLVGPAYFYIGYRESKSQEFWLFPLSFFFLWYCIGYGVAAVFMASEVFDSGYVNLLSQVVDGNDLTKAYLLTIWGALAWHGGYLLVKQRHRPNQIQRDAQDSPFFLWALLWMAGIFSLVRPDSLETIGAARAVLQLAPFGVMLSFGSLPKEHFRLKTDLYIFYLWTGNGILLLAAFYNGSKYFSMLALLPLFSAIIVRKQFRRFLPVLIITGAVLYLLVVAPVIMRTRAIHGVDSQILRMEIAAQESFQSFQEDALFAAQEETQKFLYRQFESTALGFILSDVREHGLRYGSTMENLTYAFIPRVLWPNKPVVTRGNWFTAYLGGAGSEEEATTSTGIYPQGELYWNFGVTGVLCGMFLMGCTFSALSQWVGPGPHRNAIMMMVFMNVLARTVDQASATEVMVLLIYLAVLLVLYRFGTRLRQPRG